MSRSAIIENAFVGEGHYDLGLRIGELITLQEKLGSGPNKIAQRFLEGDWLVQDVTETIRLGLIGGGMSHKDAFDLVGRVVVPGHLYDYVGLAGQVVLAALGGVEDEPMGEAAGDTEPGEPQTPWD